MKIIFERKPKKAKKFVQFSKRCLAAMIVLWFVGALFGFAVVGLQVLRGDMTVSYDVLANYIAQPIVGGLTTYMIKSAWEKHYKKNNTEDVTYE